MNGFESFWLFFLPIGRTLQVRNENALEVNDLLEAERRAIILAALKEKNTVKLQELVELTDCSESTIRRDLTQLEEEKLLKRIHGGAASLQGALTEPTMASKSSKNLQEKRRIAEYAAGLICTGDSIYLDAGSTIYEMIPFLPEGITVVTNGLMHADRLLERNIRTFLTGGNIKPTTKALIGRGAAASLELYRFDKCFLGVNGIHRDYGYTTPDPEEAMIKQQALSLARESYVIADESKFSEVFFANIADLESAVIITNEMDTDLKQQLSRHTTIKVVSE